MSPKLSYLDYVEALVGESLSASNAEMVGRFSDADLAKLREDNLAAGYDPFRDYLDSIASAPDAPSRESPDWLEWTLDRWKEAPLPYQLGPRRAGEFRPILHGIVHRAADVFGGTRAAVFEAGDSTEAHASLRRYLLYAHRVVLPDPLFHINEYFAPDCSEDLRVRSRNALIGYLDFLFVIRHLISSEIVSFYPQYENVGPENPTSMFSDWEYAAWVDERFRDSDRWAAMRQGQSMLSQLLFACARFEADCSFDQAVYEQVLATMVEFGCELDPNQVRDRIKQQERLSLRALGGVSLPGLKRLTMADIVAVRRNSDGFEGWRASLSEGLNRLEVDAASDQMVTAVQESLAQGKEKVEREIGSTGLSEALRGPAQNFGIGTVATVAAGGELSLVVGGTSAAMTALAEFFSGRKKRKSAKALRAYYSILDA